MKSSILLSIVILAELSWLAYSEYTVTAPLPSIEHAELDKSVLSDIAELERQHDPRDAKSWNQLAEIYVAFGLVKQAEYCLEQARSLSEPDAEDEFAWATVMSRQGRLDESTAAFERVVQSKYKTADAYTQLGLDYLRTNQPENAKKALSAAGPQSAMAQLCLARTLARTDDTQGALNVLSKMVEDSPNSARAHQMKSWVHLMRGENKLAKQHREISTRVGDMIMLHSSSRQRDTYWQQRVGSGRFLAESGRLQGGGNLVDALLAAEESYSCARPSFRMFAAMNLAQLAARAGQPERSLEVLRDVVLRIGESAELWEIAGNAWLAVGDDDKAVLAWQRSSRYRATQIRETNMTIQSRLAKWASDSGDEKLLKKHRGLLAYELGRLHWISGRPDAALVAFEKAVKDLADDPHVWFALGQAQRATGQAEKANDSYKKCIKLDPHYGRAKEQLEGGG